MKLKFNLSNLSIRAKLLAGFGTVLAPLSILAAITYFTLAGVQDVLETTQPKTAYLADVRHQMWSLRFDIANYVGFDTEGRQKIKGSSAEKYEAFGAALKKFTDAPGLTAEERELAKKIGEGFTNYQQVRPRWFELIDAGKMDEAVEYRAANTNKWGAYVVENTAALLDATKKNDAGRRDQQLGTVSFAHRSLTSVAVVALVMGIAAAFLVLRAIIGPVARLRDTVAKVSEGDYTARAQLQSTDELGTLGGAFDKMLEERVGALAKKEAESEALNTSIIDLMRAVAKLGKGDLTVKIPVREDITGALADAISSMADTTAKTLARVNNVSEEVRQASQLGRDIVHQTAQGMDGIRGTIQETGKRIKRLGERSQEITGIVKLIDDIAERTSVLALNANMQAAMAGEAGRGFRVVADEVQRLAERSKQATDQIGKLVSGIQAETNETTVTMERAIGEVVKGGELAEKATSQVSLIDKLGEGLLGAVRAFKLPAELLQQTAQPAAAEARKVA